MDRGWLSEGVFEAARGRIGRNWPVAVAARDELLRRADAALTETPVHVRMASGSPEFRQDGVYIPDRDGVRNPKSDMRCGHLAHRFSNAALDLAVAWRLTRDARYAERALAWIHTWCINENTRMFPTGRVVDMATPGLPYGGDVVLFLPFIRAFHAMALLNGYAGWGLPQRAAVRRWVRQMIEAQRRRMFFEGVEMTNNWEDARLAYVGFGAAALDDADILLEVFERWKDIVPLKMTDEGQLPRETMRTRSMHYTLAALRLMLIVAELGEGYGFGLYDYSVNGRSLRRAVDYAATYLLDMSAWPFEMIEPLNATGRPSEPGAVFEMAYRHWRDPRYRQVIMAWGGRPVADGHVTLLVAAED